MSQISYQRAGVDISAGNETVARIKDSVQSTFTPHVLSSLGGFAGMVDLKGITANYHHPVLVQSIDGVGTKVKLARELGRYEHLGADLLSATSNDIIVVGAKPVTMLDYIANDKLRPEIVETFIYGLANACKAHDVALIGGETAEMPGVYQPNEIDIVGIITGIAEKDQLITGEKIQPGDVVLGLSSNGLHTNGFSLVRHLLTHKNIALEKNDPMLEDTPANVLLAPHRNYTNPVFTLIKEQYEIKGMAHITGGGLTENVPRVLPKNTKVQIDLNSFPVPSVFSWLAKLGKIEQPEMFRTFNMGIGLVIVVSAALASKIQTRLTALGETVYTIGSVASSDTPHVEYI